MSAEIVWRETPADYRERRATAAAPNATKSVAAASTADQATVNQAPVGRAAEDRAAVSGAAVGGLPEGAARRRSWLRGFAFAARDDLGLRRDLGRPFAPPSAGMPITIIEIDGRELGDLLTETGERAHATAALACRYRRVLARQRIGRCFVAMASGARPCFVQFLLDHTDNQALRHAFGETFPHLLRDEALLEGAFTPANFSAERVMPAAMARIAARAEALDVRWVHSFVPITAAATLSATIAAGFAIHQCRRQRFGLWRRTTTFGPLPDDLALGFGG